ncbi:MAG: hypothetical protein F6K26_45685 [Moorea sp. SIO2I5]|nr:hypothetical protein [Moorena sp. SIO2I5]
MVNLGLLAFRPRYANSHATRTTYPTPNPKGKQPSFILNRCVDDMVRSTLAFQPSTFNLKPLTFNNNQP